MTTTRSTTNKLTTSDMTLAGLLHMLQFEYCLECVKGQPGKAAWVFERSDQLDKVVREFKLDEIRVRPDTFLKAVTYVRRRLYEFLDEADFQKLED